MSGPGGAEMSREELGATLAARHELGPEYEMALVDSLAERVEQVVRARVESQLAQRPPAPPAPSVPPWLRLTVAATSLVAAIPCLAIAGNVAGVTGVVVTWLGVVAVNVAVGISPGRGRR